MSLSTYKRFLLTLLALILAFNYVDRVALGLVLQEIKVDLHVSDTELGLLSGIAFAFFYSILGIPIARWADRGNRITIIAVTSALWSTMVVLSGMAASFVGLLFVRIGVGVGEAGCIPPAYSLIADHFDRAERPRALAIYFTGGSLSTVIGYSVAGWLNELYGWRSMFMFVGAPGLLLAILAWCTLREPRVAPFNLASGDGLAGERAPMTLERNQRVSVGLLDVCRRLLQVATFRHLLICISITYFFSWGIAQWQPTFFIRSYGLQTGQLGIWFALTGGVGGMLGTYAGGNLASRYAARNERLQLKGAAVSLLGFGVVSALVYFSPGYRSAFTLFGFANLIGTLGGGPMFAAIQGVVPERMRATAVALMFLMANLLGMGLGPLAVGALSDLFRPVLGGDSLRYALLSMCPVCLWAVWHAWRASKTVSLELQHVSDGVVSTACLRS